MKNMKAISISKSLSLLLYLLFTCSTLETSCFGENAGEEAAKKISEAIGTATKVASEKGVEATKIASTAGIEMAKIAKEGAVESSQAMAKGMVDASRELGETVVRGIAPVLGAGICVYGLVQIGHYGKDIYRHFFPNEKTIAEIKKAREKIAFYDAKKDFKECLMKNAKDKKNNFGMPVSCEKSGHAFAMTAGEAPFNEIMNNFKFAYREHGV